MLHVARIGHINAIVGTIDNQTVVFAQGYAFENVAKVKANLLSERFAQMPYEERVTEIRNLFHATSIDKVTPEINTLGCDPFAYRLRLN